MFTLMYLVLALLEFAIGIMQILFTVFINVALTFLALLGATFKGIRNCFNK